MSLLKITHFIFVFLFLAVEVEASVLPTTEKQKWDQLRNHFISRSKFRSKSERQSQQGTHILFKDQADAFKWFKDNSTLLGKLTGMKDFQVVETDARYEMVQSYVHDLWVAYAELYPEQTKGLNEPPVVFINNAQSNAFVALDPQSRRILHAVVVLTGFLKPLGVDQDRDVLSGVMGHELAHSIFRHGIPAYAEKLNRFYLEDEVLMGYQSEEKPELDLKMQDWIGNSSFAGDITSDQLLDLPSMGIGSVLGLRVLGQMRTDFFNTEATCVDALVKLKGWIGLFEYSEMDSEVFINPANIPMLQEKSQQVVDATTSCVGSQRKSLAQLLSEVLGLPTQVFESDPEFMVDAKAFDEAPNMIAALRDLVHKSRVIMQGIEKDIDFSKLGYYTFEENADDHSAIVHAYMGRNPLSLASGFYELLGGSNAQDCKMLLASGKTPKGGSFSDPHRSTCYRIHHLNHLNEVLPVKKNSISSFAQDYALKSHDSDWLIEMKSVPLNIK